MYRSEVPAQNRLGFEPSSRHAQKIDLRLGVHPGAGGSSQDATTAASLAEI
jgi:hypothetical protein